MGNRKKIIALVIALLVCVALCIGLLVGKDQPNEQTDPTQGATTPSDGPGEVINTDQTASDKETLIRLLAAEGDFAITITEDIHLDAPVSVYGNKRLTGNKSILMELWVPQYQHMLIVKKGASLTLDGAVIDGNGAASCVKVEAGAKMSLLSGEVIWGCPYGIEAYGDVEIKGGAIRETINTGLYVRSGANAYMTGGKIVDGSYTGAKIEKDAYMSISDGAVITNNKYTLVYNSGKCDITGGEMHDGGTYIAYNFGELNVKYTGKDPEGKLEWYNAGMHIISQGKTGTLNVDGLRAWNAGWHGISSSIGSATMNLKNIEIEDITQAAFYLRCGATLENIAVSKCGTAGVYVGNGSTVDIKKLTVDKSGGRGLWNFGGNVTASDVTITNARDFGVTSTYFEGLRGSVTINGLMIDGVEADMGLSANNSDITVTNGTIRNVKGENKCAAYSNNGGSITLKDVDISGTVYASVYVQGKGSAASLDNVKISGGKRGIACYGTGSVVGKNVVINETTEYSIACSNADTSVNITGLEINNCKYSTRGAVNVGSSNVTLTDVKIVKPAHNGIDINEGGTLTLTNATISDPGNCGLNVIGGNVVGSNVTITNAGNYGIYAQKEKDVEGSTKLSGLTIDTTVNMGISSNGSSVEVSGGTIKNAGAQDTPKCAGYVINGGKLSLTDVDIENAAYTGVYVENGNAYAYLEDVNISGGQRGIVCYHGKVEGKNVAISDTTGFSITSSHADSVIDLAGVTVKNCKFDGGGAVNVGGSVTTLTDLKIDGAAGHGINVDGGGKLTLNGATIQNVTKWCGIYANGGSVIGSDIIIENTKYNGIEVLADSVVTLSNVTVSGAQRNGVLVTKGTFDGKNVTIADTTWHGIHVAKEGVLKLDGAELKETTLNGIFVEGGKVTGGNVTVDTKAHGVAVSGGSLDLSKLTVTNAAKNGVNIYDKATVTLTDLAISKAGTHGINVETGSKLTLNGAKISNIETYNGIYANGGTVTGGNVTITDAKYNGIEILAGGSVTLDGLTVSGAKRNGVLITKGTFDGKNVAVSGSVWHGIHVAKEGVLKLEGAEFKDNTLNAIYVEEGAVTGGNISADNQTNGLAVSGGTVELKGLTVKNAKANGVKMYGGAEVALTDLIIDKTAEEHGIAVLEDSKLTLKGAAISNTKLNGIFVVAAKLSGENVTTDSTYHGLAVDGGEVEVTKLAAKNAVHIGVNAYNYATVELSEVTVNKAGDHGINIAEGTEVILTDAQIADVVTYNGIYANGGTLTGSNVTITNPKYHGVEVLADGSVTLTDVTVSGASQNGLLVRKGTMDVKNVSINATAYHGVHVMADGVLKLDGMQIEDATLNGIFVEGGAVTGGDVTVLSNAHGVAVSGGNAELDGVTVTDAAGNGINIYNNAEVKLSDLTVSKAGTHGINITSGSELTLDGANISNITTYNGIYVDGGSVIAKDIAIDNVNYNGVEVLNDGALTVDGLTVSGAKRNGLLGTKGVLEVKNAAINDCAWHGVHVLADAQLQIENAEFNNVTLNAIMVDGGEITGSAITCDTVTQGLAANGGSVTLTGMTVKNAKNNGVKVYGNAEVELTDLTVDATTNEHGVYVLDGAKLKFAGTNMISGAKLNSIFVQGGTVTGGNVTVTSKYHGLAVSGGNVTLDKLTVTEAAQMGVNIYSSSTVALSNLTISKAGTHGINIETGSTLTLNGANISNITTYNGIYANGGSVSGSDVTVINPKYHGIHALNSGVVNLDGVIVTDAGKNGVLVESKADVTINDLAVTNAKTEHGISVQAEGKLTLTGENTILTSKLNAIFVKGGTLEGSNVTTDGSYHGLAAEGGIVKLTGIEIKNAAYNGVKVYSNADVELTDLTVTNTTNEHGVYVLGGAKLKFAGTNTITGAKLNSIFVEGGTVTGGNVTVTSKYHGLAVSGGNVTLDKLTVTDAAKIGVKTYGSANVTLSDLSIHKAGEFGVSVETGSTLTLNGANISNITTYNGIYVNGGTLKCDETNGGTVTITNPKYNGIEVLNGGSAKLNKVVISGAHRNGVLVTKGTFECAEADISNCGWNGVHVDGAQSTARINGGTIRNIAGADKYGALAENGGKLYLKDVQMSQIAFWHVRANKSGSYIHLDNVTMTGAQRGVGAYEGAIVEGTSVKINETTSYAIAASNAGTAVTITGLGIKDCKNTSGAINVGGSQVSLTDAQIIKPAGNGADVNGGGTLTLKNVSITEPAGNGLNVIGGNVSGDTVTITTPGIYGVYAQKEGSVVGKTEIKDLTVSNVANNHGISSNGSEVIVDGGTISDVTKADKCGAFAVNSGKLSLTGVTFSGITYASVYGDNSAIVYLENVTINACQRGIVAYNGSQFTGKGVTVNETTQYAVTTGHEGTTLNLADLTVNDCKYADGGAVNVGEKTNVTLTNLIVNGAAGHGVNVVGTLTLNGATVSNITKWNGIYVNGGTLKYDETIGGTVTITNPKYNGIEVLNGGSAKLNKVVISGAPRNGVLVTKGTFECAETDITGCSWHGIHVPAEGVLKLGSAGIKNSALNGLFVEGGKVTGGEVTIDAAYHGLSVSGGNVTLDGLTVKNAEHIGLNLYTGAEVELSDVQINTTAEQAVKVHGSANVTIDGLQIDNCSSSNAAVYVAGATATLSDVTIQNLTAGHGFDIEAGGTLTLDGVTVTGAKLNGIFVKGGTLNGTDVTVNDPAYHGLAAEGGTVKLTGLKVNNAKYNGVKIYSNAEVELTDLTVTNTTNEHGVYVLGGAKLKFAGTNTITGAKLNSIFVEGGTVTGGNVTVTSKYHGLAVSGGNVTLDKLTVTDAAQMGVSIYSSSTVTLSNLTISKAGTHGINIETGSTLTLNGASISNITTYNGIYVNGGKVTGGNVTVTNPKYHGVHALNSGVVELNGVTVNNAGKSGVLAEGSANVTINELKIDTTAEQAVKVHGSANVTIDGLNIDNCKSGNAAVYVESATADLSDVSIQNFIGTAHGINLKSGTLKLNGVTVSGAKLNGIFVEAGTVTGGNITIQSPTYYGLAAAGGNITLSTVKVYSAARWALNFYGGTTANLTGVEVDGTGWEAVRIGDSASLTLKDATLKNWKTAAVKNETSGTYTPTNVTTS